MGIAARSEGDTLEIDATVVNRIAVVGKNIDVVENVSIVVDHPDIMAVLDADKEHVMGDIVIDCLWILDDGR